RETLSRKTNGVIMSHFLKLRNVVMKENVHQKRRRLFSLPITRVGIIQDPIAKAGLDLLTLLPRFSAVLQAHAISSGSICC
ncbi:hypothetical protein ACQP3J_30230, partial [Escherichia coli]